MEEVFFGISGRVTFILIHKNGSKIIHKVKNRIMNDGRNMLAKAMLAGCGSSVQVITGSPYIAVGTGDTAPSFTDTVLDSELARKIVTPALMERQNKTAFYETTFELAEAIPTPPAELKEAGLFIDNATASPDTGILVARALILPTLAKNIYQKLIVRWAFIIDRKE